MGIVDGTGGLGLEGSGIVRKVGSSVKGLKVGDRVMMMGDSTFSTERTISYKRCAKMPDDLSFEDAATMPCVYVTVIHSLITAGQLQKGQSVLIHSACGGVGLAAIQVAQMIGAEVC